MKLYLFKRAADGAWIFGESTDHEHPSGVCRIAPNTDRTMVGIFYLQKNEATQNRYDIPVTSIYKENDTAYADFAALKAGFAGFFAGEGSGIALGEYDAVLSDTVDFVTPGWIRPMLLAGTIKYTTAKGDVRTNAFDLKETSLVKVKRVWLTGTTAAMGIVVYTE